MTKEYQFGKTRVIIDDSYVRRGDELESLLKKARLKREKAAYGDATNSRLDT